MRAHVTVQTEGHREGTWGFTVITPLCIISCQVTLYCCVYAYRQKLTEEIQ